MACNDTINIHMALGREKLPQPTKESTFIPKDEEGRAGWPWDPPTDSSHILKPSSPGTLDWEAPAPQ